jgi:RHS repeat-associated protein
MPVQALQGSDFTAEDKLDKLRQQIHGKKYQDKDEVRKFINRYLAANPEEVRGRSTSVVNEIVGNIRSELGLGLSDQIGVTKVISDHVKNLILGHSQASDDSARWAVHHAANQITMYSGQFVYDAEDIFIDSAGIDFLFQRTYKSQGYYNGPLGINWDYNYNLRLRKVDGENKIVLLTGGFQESTYIKHGLYGQAGFNYWIPPEGEHSIIIDISGLPSRQEYGVQLPQSCQNCQYALRTADGALYVYENDSGLTGHYRIKRIQDRFTNYLEFIYEQIPGEAGSRIRQIFINNPARWVLFGYDSQNRITAIKDHADRIWRYTYDDLGDLITFTTPGTDRYKSGLTERYVYSTPYYTGELQHNLTQVYDTAGRLYIENKYGTDTGLLSFNRVVRQHEGKGERFFEYEDVSLASGLPAGQPEIEEDMPAHQTVMVRRNGHPVHYIYNKFGNLIAREEDIWTSGIRRRLVNHYRYNRDGALIGEVSPEGRMTQYLYGRDEFIHDIGDFTEDQLRKRYELNWKKRLSFGNRLAVVQRFRKKYAANFQFPGPLRDIYDVTTHHPEDIIVKFTYETTFQNIESISDPRYTKKPFTGEQEDNKYKKTLTSLKYHLSNGCLEVIKYPDIVQADQSDLKNIEEHFLVYDGNGRLTKYEDRAGTLMELTYFPPSANSAEAAKEGHLSCQIIDPKSQNNLNGLNLKTQYKINEVGAVTHIKLPKSTVVEFAVNDLNQITKVTRALKPNTKYDTRYTYCRNMRTERIERDVQDENGQPLWGDTEVQFLHYDENDNVSRQQIGSPDFSDHLITHHTYDDGDLRVGTTLPRGNRIHISYDERRLPKNIERVVGSSESVKVKVVYDGDGLLCKQRDGRGMKTEFDYNSFGRLIETRDYDEHDNLYRLIRQDYDKAGNLTIERMFKPDGNAYKLLYHASYRYDELNQRIENRLRCFQIPIACTSADVEKDNDYVPLAEAVRILYFYDKAGRPIRVEQHGRRLDANGQPQLQDTILSSKYEYNSVGWLIAETDQLGNRTERHYDKHGLLTRVDVREKVPLAYSPTGEEIFTTLYKYDDLDRMKSVKDGLGNTTRFEYDSRDSIIRQEDPLGNITRFDYDIYGRQVAERIEMTETGLGGGARQPNSDIVTQYVFDANSNLIRLVDAHNTPTYQVYDALDRRIELRFVDGTATKYKYDCNDNVVWLQDNNGLIKRTIYDPLDNPVRMDVDKNELKPNLVAEGTMYETFEYNVLGQMTRAKNDWADIHFKVDSLGRTYKESVKFFDQASVFTLKRAYDDFDFLSRLTYPNGRTIVYQPDELNRIKRIENKAYGANYPGDTNLPQQRMILENTHRGLRIGLKSYGNGASTDYAYDSTGRIISISHRDAQNAELLTIQHLYDAAGNMRFKYEFAPNENYGEVYKYDSRSQLTLFQEIQPSPTNADHLNLKALAPATSMLADHQHKGQSQVIDPMLGSLAQVHNQFTFKYDKLGNRLEERAPNQAQPITYIPNNLNQYIKRNNTQYYYDPNGNLSQEKTGAYARDYIYNHRNQIVRVTEGGNLARFHYDALGRRIWSDTSGVKSYFLYNDDNIIDEWCPAIQQHTKRSIQYVNEFKIDSHCQVAVNASEYCYHKDLVTSTRLLTNLNGIMKVNYRYLPFGSLTHGLPQLHNPYLFTGRRYDQTIDSYDFRARKYSPELGRFCQRDPNGHEEEINYFKYVSNNPETLIDPKGLAGEDPEQLFLSQSKPYRQPVKATASGRGIYSSTRANLIKAAAIWGGPEGPIHAGHIGKPFALTRAGETSYVWAQNQSSNTRQGASLEKADVAKARSQGHFARVHGVDPITPKGTRYGTHPVNKAFLERQFIEWQEPTPVTEHTAPATRSAVPTGKASRLPTQLDLPFGQRSLPSVEINPIPKAKPSATITETSINNIRPVVGGLALPKPVACGMAILGPLGIALGAISFYLAEKQKEEMIRYWEKRGWSRPGLERLGTQIRQAGGYIVVGDQIIPGI